MTDAHLFAVGVVLAWLAGIRVYLTVFGVGLAGAFGWLDLPSALEVTQSPWVIGVSGVLAAAEFFTDKIPGIDSGCGPAAHLAARAGRRVPGGGHAVRRWRTRCRRAGHRRRRGADQPRAQERHARVAQHLARTGQQLDRLGHRGRRRGRRPGAGVRASVDRVVDAWCWSACWSRAGVWWVWRRLFRRAPRVPG